MSRQGVGWDPGGSGWGLKTQMVNIPDHGVVPLRGVEKFGSFPGRVGFVHLT